MISFWSRIVLAAFIAGLLWSVAPAAEKAGPNVVVITIDTLRADHLACYGYKRIKTPNIDQLAKSGVRFSNAFTAVPITLPSHTALMTGQYPMATGVHDFSGNKLPPGSMTLARVLQSHGYSTAAFIASAALDSRFGLNQGFDTYYDHFNLGHSREIHLDEIERRGDKVVDLALKWLESHHQKPFFLWVHLYDPHAPYDPPEPYARLYRTHPYDGEIAFADAQVGRLFGYLKQQHLYENSLIVLASDHGESLGEHGEKTHGFFIYNATLHVALIVRIPGDPPRVVQQGVSLVDVMPAVLQALGIARPASVQGQSLLSLMLGRPSGIDSGQYSENYAPLIHFGWNRLLGIEWRGMEYIETTRPELYDLKADPDELHNLYSTHQALAHEMNQRLQDLIRRYTSASKASAAAGRSTDPALLASLRSLGYAAVSVANLPQADTRNLPDPKDRVQAYNLVSEALVDKQRGRYQESLRELLEAEKTAPETLTIRFLVAQNKLKLKEFARATAGFQYVSERNPNDGAAVYYLGVAQLGSGNIDGAEKSFERALKIDPRNFSAAYDLGVAYTRQRRADAAIAAFKQAVEILPEYAEAHEALGELYLYLQRPSEAAKELEQAVAADPRMAKAHYELGRAYHALGLEEKAQSEFRRAREP
ncbi:MAG TPA: sulfatase-like hydrolase/transferase [Terriglobia bacterium]|nr:sulfatase-like hydrolase/transferase [Terriglobia bacterium]